jgi:hypothetical protein
MNSARQLKATVGALGRASPRGWQWRETGVKDHPLDVGARAVRARVSAVLRSEGAHPLDRATL